MIVVMVRAAVSTDIDQILRIVSSAEVDKSRHLVVQRAIDGGECLIALNQGIVVGFATMNHGFLTVASYRLFMSIQHSAGAR